MTIKRPLTGGSLDLSDLFLLELMAAVVRWAGMCWDVSWHRTVGRDSFFIPPHLLAYAGVALGMGIVLRAFFDTRGAVARAFAVALGGYVVILLSAPFDDWWHTTFGRDVDVWSPPHLIAMGAGVIVMLVWSGVALEAAGRGVRRAARCAAALAGFALFTGWFSLNWYQMASATRDVRLYPALATLVWLPILVGIARQRGPVTATQAALVFTLLAAAPMPVLWAIGWRAPAFPPLMVVGALAVDLIERQRFGSPVRVLLQGLAFPLSLVAVEALRFQVVPAAAVIGPEVEFAAPYLVAAAAHPWTLGSIVATLPLLLPIGAVAALVGAVLGRLWARVQADRAEWSGLPARRADGVVRA